MLGRGTKERKKKGGKSAHGNGNGNGHGNGAAALEAIAAADAASLAPDVPARLVDLAGDWLALIASLRGVPELPDPAPLRSRALELKDLLEQRAKERGIAEADVQAAVFSLTAFFDEAVRRGKGRARDEWISTPLQLEWFRTARAGDEFYERLDELRKDRSRRIEPLEVATACVALGFEGKLATAREKRVALLGDLLADITAVRGSGETALAPHVLGRDRPVGTVVPELPRWVSIVAFVVGALLLWLGISQLSHLGAARAVHEINAPLGR